MIHCQGLFSIAKWCCLRLLRAFKRSRETPSHPQTDTNALFCYTSGRWLWNEREQLEARYRRFDVPSLQRVACQAVDADKCISFEKIGEGQSNKAYRLVMEDSQRVIAKVPNPNAGPRQLTAASEVATMEFAQTILNMPVPRVLAWSATDKNPVQAEYIVMEEARGTRLHKVWPYLPLDKKAGIVWELVDTERKLLSVSFNRLGCLYFKESAIAGCEPSIVTDGPQDVVSQIESTCLIGLITQAEFWEKERSGMPYKGPWTSAAEYLESVVRHEIDWIKTHAKSHPRDHSIRLSCTRVQDRNPQRLT